MPNPFYTYKLNMYNLVWLYGISNSLGCLKPNPIPTYTSNIYSIDSFGFLAFQPLLIIQYQIHFLYVYQLYIIWSGWVLCHIDH